MVDSATKFVLQNSGIKEGSRRVVDVAINCNEDSYADAQKSLKLEIAYATKNYEKLITAVGFDIRSCD